ncbi:MAG: carboxymuconolactone decarboxylase family protein [Betaproteobacteria bacterium]|nr:carboxymuconolactone decarboxylase family protein [Betaproteobacteria bacterium]
MARLPFIDEHNPLLAALIAKVKGARGGKLLNLYRVLMNSPPIADAWQAFNNAVRFHTGLDEQTRELAILRVAQLTGATYQFQIHAEKYAPQVGITPQQIAALDGSEYSSLFQPAHRALLAYADAMTQTIEVPDAIFERLRVHYTSAQIVDLTVLIGAYNMHARVGRALQLDPED